MATITPRTSKTGKRTFQVKIRMGGFNISRTFKGNRAERDAKTFAAVTEDAIDKGTYQPEGEAQTHTLDDLIAEYLANVMPDKAKGTQDAQRPQLRWWGDMLGHLPLTGRDALQPADILDALAELDRTPPTKNRYLAALSHAFTYARKVRHWIQDSPVDRIDKRTAGIRENKGRVRFLAPDERSALLAACKGSAHPHLYPAVVLALSTGMRAGEQFGLTWDRVDLKTGRILLVDTKNGERRAVHVAGHALELLRGMVQRLDNRHVFPAAEGRGPWKYRAVWERAVAKAGIENFRWHDLRHSFASELAMSGATQAELMEAMGHKSPQMVARYAHLGEPHMAGVVERMTSRLFGGEG